MKIRIIAFGLLCSFFVAQAYAAEPFGDALGRTMTEYRERLQQAGAELSAAREEIAQEKAPLLKAQRAAEDRIITANEEITRLNTAQEESLERRRRLIKDADLLNKNANYAIMLSQEGLKAFADGLAPGEDQLVGESLEVLRQPLEEASSGTKIKTTMAAVDFLFDQVSKAVGGYSAAGNSRVGEQSQSVKGRFAFMGPETYFHADQGGAAGIVMRLREGAALPVTYLLNDWTAESAKALFEGKPGLIMVDASGGKALRLKTNQGNLWQHIDKGGMVAYVIVAVGLIALLMIVLKVRDLNAMAVDRPEKVRGFLITLSEGTPTQIQTALESLQSSTREVFAMGVRQISKPKIALEEHMVAVLLKQRLHYERWLPLLAVIATAAPLLGLLGTVMGMVKTFALITVFGTGNAGKLASGISEVLVATELGLMVAIPTLVAHGFIAHRIQKKLSLLERYAQEFVTVTKSDKARIDDEEAVNA